jgi:arylsulfatase A-like enzyme
MGEYIAAVKELGDLNNTIVCISSDHGELLGDHNDW